MSHITQIGPAYQRHVQTAMSGAIYITNWMCRKLES